MMTTTMRKILVLHITCTAIVSAQYYSGEGPTAQNNGCFTPDYTQGLCVPMAKCRRIEWLLRNWSPPYPAHIARYVRQSHCGSQGDEHYACCAFYDIKDHHHYSQQPPKIPKPSPSPTFIRNPHHGTQNSNAPENLKKFTSDPLDSNFEQPRVNYLQQSIGERILRSISCGATVNGARIANGEFVRLSEFPWMVLLKSDGVKSRQRFRCAGTLITHQYVLTAAHCVQEKNEVISVRLGEHDLSRENDCEDRKRNSNCAPPYEDVPIERVITHPDYSLNPLQSDIALVRLQKAVEFNSHIAPICLPLDTSANSEIPTQQTVAGWGVTENGYASNVLIKANIPLRSFEVCQKHFSQNRLNAKEHLCAGGVDSRGTCRADSGGPLFTAAYHGHHQLRYVQFGVTSAGSYACGDGKRNVPGVYTKVDNYITWIMANIY